MKCLKNENGFTLAEMAICLVIIGILLAGVFMGEEILMNARISSVISQVKSYQAAIVSFRDQYGTLPGDYAQAATKIPGCINDCATYVGNSDGQINARVPGPSPFLENWNVPYNASRDSENRLLWLHLAVSKMIKGVDDTGTYKRAWGKSYPKAKFGGGFDMVNIKFLTLHWAYLPMIGTFIELRAVPFPNQAYVNEDFGKSALYPKYAKRIEDKMDNGDYLGGEVITMGWDGNCHTWVPPVTWIETTETKGCNLLFRAIP